MRYAAGQRGWTVVEVAIASGISALVMGGAVALISLASSSAEDVSNSSRSNRRDGEVQGDFRRELTQAVLSGIDIQSVSGGNDMITFQMMVERIGIVSEGIHWTLTDRPVDVVELMARADSDNQVPLAGKEHDPDSPHHNHYYRYTVIPEVDGTLSLYKLILDSKFELEGAGLVVDDVTRFSVGRSGDSIKVELSIATETGEEKVWDSTVLPKN